MPHRWQLGKILIEDFGWTPDDVERLATERTARRDGPPIGTYFRRFAAAEHRSFEIPLALLIQRSEGGSPASATRFALEEYRELGMLYRFDRKDIDSQVRTYSALVLTLVLFIAYPLNVIFTQAATSRVLPPGILLLYAATGLFLVLLTMWVGDYTVKHYGQFLKRRIRVSRSRAILRSYFSAADLRILTAMPTRRAGTDERPDPELAGFQQFLPLIYSVWCSIKLGFAIYFVALLWKQSLDFTVPELRGPIAAVLIFGPIWIQIVGSMCERYHKCLKEALVLSEHKPFPLASTEHLRRTGRLQRLLSFGTVYWILAIGVWISATVVFFTAPNASVYVGRVQLLVQEAALGVMGALLLTAMLIRVVDVRDRVHHMKIR